MKIEKTDKISIGFGIVSYLMAFFAESWYAVIGNTENPTLNVFLPPSIPVFLWLMCLVLLGFLKKKNWKCYLWLFLSAPFCFRNLVETLLTFLAWSNNGFAP